MAAVQADAGNGIGDSGTTAIADLMRHNTSLTDIILGARACGPVCSFACPYRLQGSALLIMGHACAGDVFGAAGASALMHALKTNFVLCEIFTEDDKLSEELERYYRLPRVRFVVCARQAGPALWVRATKS